MSWFIWALFIVCFVGGFIGGVVATRIQRDDREDFSEPWYEDEHEPTTTKR